MTSADTSILLVDLNNFARYPSLPIGYLAAVLRGAGHAVQVFAPLMVGVKGVAREPRPHRLSLAMAKLNHRAAVSSHAWVRQWRDKLAAQRLSGIRQHEAEVVAAFTSQLDASRPAVVLVSTYLMYRSICERICVMCRERGVRVVIGGPYFTQPEVIAEWVAMPGLDALVAGEVEMRLPAIVKTVLEGGDASVHEGVMVAGADGRPRGRVARPLIELDDVPYPDYSDFPWQAYPNRIVPIITGRGCGWGACMFCSDVTSTAGRTFRSRSAANVLGELAFHHQRFSASRFVFTDLKLNSHLPMWRSLIDGVQQAAPGARWIGAVHANAGGENGLSEFDLRQAARSGCTRLTTGLETGSQRMADTMKKGTSLESISAFLHSAAAAGISNRCTMMLGHPGETADDVHASADFLQRHGTVIERVSLNRLSVITGTTLHRALQRKPQKFEGFRIVAERPAMAQLDHHHHVTATRAHRKAVMRLLSEVHRINARELSPKAREFEGVM
jgi:anaerobic magnesium-protoporphyrin IX monomethyl ester cyclase